MAEREREVIVTDDGPRGGGGALIAVVMLIVVVVVLFLIFGRGLLSGSSETKVDVDVNPTSGR